MIKNTLRIKYGVIFLVPLLISILLVGFNNTNASYGELELNQSEVTILSGANIWLDLTANGVTIDGDSTVNSMDRENKIELWSFRMEVQTARDASSGMASGERTYSSIFMTKQIDQSSPLLFKALTKNEVMEGTFKFFRPNPLGDGSEEHYYTVYFSEGRMASFKTFTLTDFNSGTTMDMEEVSFVFGLIRITYETTGICCLSNFNKSLHAIICNLSISSHFKRNIRTFQMIKPLHSNP